MSSVSLFLCNLVWSLNCYCENSRLCSGDVDNCSAEEGDACIVSVTVDGYEYSCYRSAGRVTEHFVSQCLSGALTTGEHRGIVCCNDRDFCNMDLHPTLAPSHDQLITTQLTPSEETTETAGIIILASVHSY